MTNFEKIKENIASFSTCEMAEFLSRYWQCTLCPVFKECNEKDAINCYEMLGEWLERDSESEEKEIMIKHCYLFVFDNDETFEIDVDSLKTAVCKAADYWGDNSDLFQKSLKGFEETDIDGIIKLFNRFCQVTITKVYEIKSVLWEEKKKNE